MSAFPVISLFIFKEELYLGIRTNTKALNSIVTFRSLVLLRPDHYLRADHNC